MASRKGEAPGEDGSPASLLHPKKRPGTSEADKSPAAGRLAGESPEGDTTLRKRRGRASGGPAGQEPVRVSEAGWGTAQLSLPLLLAASPSCRVRGPDVTSHPRTRARLAPETLPPSTPFRRRLICSRTLWSAEPDARLQPDGSSSTRRTQRAPAALHPRHKRRHRTFEVTDLSDQIP